MIPSWYLGGTIQYPSTGCRLISIHSMWVVPEPQCLTGTQSCHSPFEAELFFECQLNTVIGPLPMDCTTVNHQWLLLACLSRGAERREAGEK